MDRILYIGDFNNRKSQELKEKSIEYLRENKGDKFYYLLPNGELLKEVRNEFINEVEGTYEVNVFTFDDIVGRILKNSRKRKIGNPMKNIIIREVLKELNEEDKIIYYKDQIGMEGFYRSLNDIIGEIKRSLLLADEYLANCPEKRKYKEVGLIYKRYEEVLEEHKLMDREGEYLESLKLLEEENILEALEFIVIDEFYDFRPIEVAILREMAKLDIDIYINMPFRTEVKSPILEKTKKDFLELGFKIENIEKDKFTDFEKLSRFIFSDKTNFYENKGKIKRIVAPNRYLEMKRIFEEIKKLNKEGYKLEDLAIVLTNNDYEDILHRVAKEEELAISLPKTSKLRDETIIREALLILENRINRGDKSILINRLKSNYFKLLDRREREKYEILLRGENFEYLEDLKELLLSQEELNFLEEDIEIINKIIKLVEEEFDKIPLSSDIRNYNKIMVDLIKDFKIKENILNRFASSEDEDLFLRDMRTLDKFIQLLEEMDNTYFEGKLISLEDYYFILEQYLEDEEILEVDGNSKGIHILNPVSGRGLGKKVIFILGLYQGNYPSIQNKGYFLNDYNLKDLVNSGLNMETYLERMDNEALKFASILAQIQDKLYISYNKGEDGSNIPSMFWDDLLSLIKLDSDDNLIEVDFRYRIKEELESVTNKKDFLRYFINKSKEDEYFEEDLYELNEILNDEVLDELLEINIGEYYRENNIINEYSGLLKDDTLVEELDSKLANKYSISNLEAYAECPFSYMLDRILKVEEIERQYEDYSPIDIGIIYHEVLNKFYLKNREEIKDLINKDLDFKIEDKEDEIRKLVDKESEKNGLDKEVSKDRLIISDIVNKLTAYIAEDIERLKEDKLLPKYFEEEFGYRDEFIIDSLDKQVPMYGRIDRIDKFIEEDKFVIMDYKSSSYNMQDIDDMKDGLSLQLPVYILSQEEKGKNIVAAGYGIIRDKKLNLRLGLVDETSIITRRSKGGIERDELDELLELTKENIVTIVDNIRSGKFVVVPKYCSDYCKYKDICRYEDRIEVVE